MKLLAGTLDLQNAKFLSQGRGTASGQATELVMEALGQFFIKGKANDFQLLAESYLQDKENICAQLSGSYLIALYDVQKTALLLLQDRFGSPLSLYYCENAGKLFFSTSLKELLLRSAMPRELNEAVIEEFLLNGYIYGKETLLKQVFKLMPGNALYVQNGQVRQMEMRYPLKVLSPGSALSNWDNSLRLAVQACFAEEAEASLPISSGYDSNYILHVAATANVPNINAFCIGGKSGKNELPAVEDNMRHYPQAKLFAALTSQDTLQSFPDLVWRLEGAVYESGIFLQYELAKLVKANGKKSLICGECADQVMNEHFFSPERVRPNQSANDLLYYAFDEYPYVFASYLILKKNGILLNSHGIEGRYPFLNEDFISVAKALTLLNGKDKRCHVANCHSLLPGEILANLSKIGGSTDLQSLFDCSAEAQSIVDYVQQSDFYQRFQKQIRRQSYAAKVEQKGLAKIKTRLRNLLLSLLGLGRENRRKNAVFMREMQLKEFLCVLYLILFEKLIIKEEFGVPLNAEQCTLKLKEILQK